MVDRITPSTSLADRDEVARRFGVDDRWPVVTESFSQWVMEDEFCNGRPPLEGVGVQFVPDVSAYELMKTRLLNGSHSALGHLGHLAGHVRMDEAMADPDLSGFVTRLMAEEVAPLLPAPEGIDLAHYQRTLLQRFADPAIADRLDRLCRRGSSKVPLYLLPSLREALDDGRQADLLTLAVAGFCRYLRGTDMQGRSFPVPDERAEELRVLAVAGGTDPRPLLGVRAVFGDLGDRPEFVEALTAALQQLDRDGVRATLAANLDSTGSVRHDAVGAAAGRRGRAPAGRRNTVADPVAPVAGGALMPA
jgi:fructuronate reductase/mannitol 2-dehydrogenase